MVWFLSNMPLYLDLWTLSYRAVQHPRVPETQEFVRVHSYQSQMVIRPHKSFDEVCEECFATYIDLICFHGPVFCSHWVWLVCFPLQNGFDYLLTYSDNPQTVFPRYCVNWMVSSGELFFAGWKWLRLHLKVIVYWLVVVFFAPTNSLNLKDITFTMTLSSKFLCLTS